MAEFTNTDALDTCDAVDCRAPSAPAPDWLPRRLLRVDYLAKDFDSFLRVMLDEVSRTLPGWRDRSQADLGMAVLQLIAYFADQISYYQDRVFREGHIETATQFESLRSLLRLIDYAPPLGRSAQTYVAFDVDQSKVLFEGFEVASRADPTTKERVVFHVETQRLLHLELNALVLAADAPIGADRTEVRVNLANPALLTRGDLVAFVRGTEVEVATIEATPAAGPGVGETTLVVTALERDFAAADTQVLGNVARLSHGAAIPVEASERLVIASGEAHQRIPLSFAPISRTGTPPRSTLSLRVDGVEWTEVDSFLGSEANDEDFVVTFDNSGYGTIVLGDGVHGRVPATGALIEIAYRIGLGRTGMVARDTLTEFVDPEDRIRLARNIVPSFGGAEPATLDELRLLGPASIRKQERVVSLGDYAERALEPLVVDGREVHILHARAERGWSGTWETVTVHVDLRGAPEGTAAALEAKLESMRMAARDVVVRPARYAPLNIGLSVQIAPEYFQRHVRAEIEIALDALFAPEHFGFGDGVHLSQIVKAVMDVDGVESVCPIRFKRLGDRFPDEKAKGVIRVRKSEIPRCDRNPEQPEDGILYLKMLGGKAG